MSETSAAEQRGFIDAEPAKPVESEAKASRGEQARSAAYRSRFVLVYAALALVAGVAVGTFFVLALQPDPKPEPAWSAWQPTGSAVAQERQIADRVSKRYRQANGEQLVAAIVSAPKVVGSTGDLPVSAIAIRPDTSTGKKEESAIDILSAGSGLQYVLCGLGQACSIKGGTPSVARHALLRREALELALYTFKYVDGISSVSVFLPPRPDGRASGTTVFLKKSDVTKELSKPLAETLGITVPKLGAIPKHELALVNRITEPRLYTYEYQQAQDGGAILIYNPVVLGA